MRWETWWWDIFVRHSFFFFVVMMVVVMVIVMMVVVMIVVVIVVMIVMVVSVVIVVVVSVVIVVVAMVVIMMVTVMMTWRWMGITMRRNTYRRRLIPFLHTLKLALDIFEYIIVKTVVVGMTMWWNTNRRRGMSRGIDNRESGFFECISRGGDIDDRKSRFGFRS
jgi:hypothetical protein